MSCGGIVVLHFIFVQGQQDCRGVKKSRRVSTGLDFAGASEMMGRDDSAFGGVDIKSLLLVKEKWCVVETLQ